mgnify:CR=1 FL=1
MIIAYLQNTSTGKIYKAVNNKILLLWLSSRKEWVRCTTTYEDLFIGDYMNSFELINDSQIGEYL